MQPVAIRGSMEVETRDPMPAPRPENRTRTGAQTAALLGFYRQACVDAGVMPLPDHLALQLLAIVFACLEPVDTGPLH